MTDKTKETKPTEEDTLKLREEKLLLLDKEAEIIINNQKDIIKFNVSGELFATKSNTLLNVKDSLFYKIVLSKKFDLSKEIFIDRDFKYFGDILDYLRSGKFNYNKYSSKQELEEIKAEADYYELVDILSTIEERLKEPVFISFTFSGVYNTSGTVVGTNKLEDISDRNLNTGICATSPGWITFELNHEFDISKVEIAGFNGNTTYWGPSNGSGASIMVSKDNINWKTVGSIPSSFASAIVQVDLTSTTGKYLKLQHTSYLGISYLKVIKS